MFYLIFNERVIDKAIEPFPVADPMTWVESGQEYVPYSCSYIDGAFVEDAVPEPVEPAMPVDEKVDILWDIVVNGGSSLRAAQTMEEYSGKVNK